MIRRFLIFNHQGLGGDTRYTLLGLLGLTDFSPIEFDTIADMKVGDTKYFETFRIYRVE